MLLKLPPSPAPLAPITDAEIKDTTSIKMTWAQVTANADPKKNFVANVVVRDPKRAARDLEKVEESWAPVVQPMLKQAGRGMGHRVDVAMPKKKVTPVEKKEEAPRNDSFENGPAGKGREDTMKVDPKVRAESRRRHSEKKRQEEGGSRRQDSLDPSSSLPDKGEGEKRDRQRQQRQEGGQSSREELGVSAGQGGGAGAGRSTETGGKKH